MTATAMKDTSIMSAPRPRRRLGSGDLKPVRKEPPEGRNADPPQDVAQGQGLAVARSAPETGLRQEVAQLREDLVQARRRIAELEAERDTLNGKLRTVKATIADKGMSNVKPLSEKAAPYGAFAKDRRTQAILFALGKAARDGFNTDELISLRDELSRYFHCKGIVSNASKRRYAINHAQKMNLRESIVELLDYYPDPEPGSGAAPAVPLLPWEEFGQAAGLALGHLADDDLETHEVEY